MKVTLPPHLSSVASQPHTSLPFLHTESTMIFQTLRPCTVLVRQYATGCRSLLIASPSSYHHCLPSLHTPTPSVASSCNNLSSSRHFASSGNLNGDSSIIDSTAATTQWKRNQYRKLGEKFQHNLQDDTSATRSDDAATAGDEPLQIDDYEDVQPMWKQMESRVTRRRSFTLEQRGGVSGRRNVRKSDEDVWLQAGVYDSPEDTDDDEKEKK